MLPLVLQLFRGIAAAQECPPSFYKSLPRENGEFYYGAGKGDDFNEARRSALDRLGDMAIGPNYIGGNAESVRLRGWEQDDRAECKRKFYVLVRISKAQLAENLKELPVVSPAANARPQSTPIVVKVVLPKQHFTPPKLELPAESNRVPHRDATSDFPLAWLIVSAATILAVLVGWFISHPRPDRIHPELRIAEPKPSPTVVASLVHPAPLPIPPPTRSTSQPQSIAAGLTNEDRVIGELQKRQPLCDDCLSRDLSIFPRQQINQICRRLEDKGVLSRFKDTCLGRAGEFKTVNKLT